MSLVDAFKAEDRVEVKFSDFYNLMKEATKAELLMNGIKCDTPFPYMREMMTGKREDFAHVDCDITAYIKPVFCGVDTANGESESVLPWETPGQDQEEAQEPEETQEEAQEGEQAQETKESEG